MRFVATGSWLLSATVDTCLLPWNHLAICVQPHSLCRQPFNNCRSVFHSCYHFLLLLLSLHLLLLLLLHLLLLLLLLLPLLLPVCSHCHCDVCLISQFISCQTACQCLSLFGVAIAISTRFCLSYAYSVCAVSSDSSVSPVCSAFSASSTSFSAFICLRKSEKPKATPVKMFEFDVLTVCPRLALCYSCLAYAKGLPFLDIQVCVCVCVDA